MLFNVSKQIAFKSNVKVEPELDLRLFYTTDRIYKGTGLLM